MRLCQQKYNTTPLFCDLLNPCPARAKDRLPKNAAQAPTAVVVKPRTGNVGIADAAPEFRLELPNTADAAGQGRANAWKTYSSQRWKVNVRTVEHAMDKIRSLRGASFDWKEQDARIAELEQTVAQNKRLEQRLETLERLLQQQCEYP